LNLNKNADINIFLKKEAKNISSQISYEFTFTCREANIKILKLNYMVNGNKNNYWFVLNNKTVATVLLACLTAFLSFC